MIFLLVITLPFPPKNALSFTTALLVDLAAIYIGGISEKHKPGFRQTTTTGVKMPVCFAVTPAR
jgi:hypothetical protein